MDDAKTPLYLGFCGRAEHGKTTAVDTIDAYATGQGLKVYQASFGRIVAQYCVKTRQLPEIFDRVRATPEQLKIIVDVGMEMREAFGDWFWLDQFDIEVHSKQPDVVLCPNVRLPNEVEWVKEHNGSLIRMMRLNADGTEYISPTRDPNHPTETSTAFINADFCITAKDGQEELVKWFAVDIFHFVRQRVGLQSKS